jgi:hypothetical protein
MSPIENDTLVFGNSKLDVLGSSSGEEIVPLEVKVVKQKEQNRLRKGFNQILTYLRTIEVTEGFYVVFCRGDFVLEIPKTILVGKFEKSFTLNPTSPL